MTTTHKHQRKRLLTAGLTALLLTSTGGGVFCHAEDVTPASTHENEITVNDGGYAINGETTPFVGNYNYFYGGGNETNYEAAFDNLLQIYGGTFEAVFGGMSRITAHGNFIIINNGDIGGAVGGVNIYYGDGFSGNVFGNSVVINGGKVGYVSGGEIAYAYRTDSTAPTEFVNALGNVYNNEVFINGGEISNGVVGGSALGGNAYGNKIYLVGGKVSGDVIGGKSISGLATGNEININGGIDLTNANLIGGKVGDQISPKGNTLNINTWNVTAQSIDGFEFINFTNPLTVGTGLTLTNSANLYGGINNIGVLLRGDSNIGVGSALNLIYSNNGININDMSGLASSADLITGNNTYLTTMRKGVTFDYALALSLSEDGKSLTGVVEQNLGPNDETAITSKAQLANVVPINTGTNVLIDGFNDFVGSNIAEDDEGYFTDKAQAAEEVREQHGFEIFGNVGYGKLRTKTGDGGHLNTETANFDLGLARTYDSPSGRWTIAPVFEHGKGNYDAVLSNGVRGFGDTKYYAGGLIGRRMTDSGFYVEMSARLGRTKNDFASNDFIYRNEPIRATYHTSAPIFAGHVRLGKAMRLNKSNLLDVYGIYAYTRQGGTSATLSTGEPYKFSSVTSSRFRLGYRLTTRTSKISRIYTGLAYQYENTSDSETRAFDGDGNYWSLPSAGSKGSSGMIEIGWLIKPKQDNPWFVDMNATAWFGHQKGVTAMAKIKKSF